MVTSATQIRLEAYAPADVEEPTPLLATEAPTIGDDGKTITYTIRDDVKFSPPVDREATAADVKYAIERSLLPGVPNGYVQTYLAGVEGIDEAVKAGQANPTGGAPDISGITAPDDTTLEIKLTNTSSLGVIGASRSRSAHRFRRSTRRSSTPRTRRPTARTRSPPART